MNYKTTEQKVINFIASNKLLEANHKILIALSGGADSVFMLFFLNKFKKMFKISIAAAHINHSLRGKEAGKDQIFSENLCSELKIPFFAKKVYVKSFAKKNQISIEDAARRLRYSSLQKIAKNISADRIATAHNIDDNAETILFNLARGTGISGLAGIPYKRDSIIRPILILSKKEIIEYLNKFGLDYRIDSTNFDESFSRNLIRNRIIPLMRENLNPSVSQSIFKFSNLFKSYSQFLNSQLAEIEQKYCKYQDNSLSIKLELMEHYDEFLLGELLKLLFGKYFSSEYGYNDYLKIKYLINKSPGKKVLFKNKLTAIRERDSIIFIKNNNMEIFAEKKIVPGEFVETKTGKIHISAISNKKNSKASNRFSEIISGDNLNDIFILRKWKNGDKFIPLGMKNFKKISTFLTEQKVPSRLKKEQLVLTNNGNIVWVVGYRLDNRYRVLANTKKIVNIWKTKT